MQYTLMHKNIAVADMELDEATSSIQHIDAVYRPEHLPVATASKRDGVDRAALNAWWIDRCIPASRSGVRKALETLHLPQDFPASLAFRLFSRKLLHSFSLLLPDLISASYCAS